MSLDAIERDFRDKVAAKVRLVEECVGRYRVFTAFEFQSQLLPPLTYSVSPVM